MSKNRSAGRAGKSFFKRSTALAGVAALAALIPTAALAQDAEEEEEEEAIVVTGTRIQSEFNSPSPLQVITTENSTLAGISDAGEMVQNSSIAAGSPQIDATISSAFVTDGGPGAQTVSLRGLGANRTLVLLNGRRAGPAGTRGAVSAFDLNVLPIGIVDRIEILKDGASSIYGSDAIAGVVNIITDTDMDGGEFNLNLSVPNDPGGAEGSIELAWGRSFDRGHILGSLSYYSQEETTLGERSYTNCATSNTIDLNTGARNDIIDLRTGNYACRSPSNTATGLVWLYDYSYLYQGNNLANGFAPNFIQPDFSNQTGVLFPGTIVPAPFNSFAAGVPASWFQVNFNTPGPADPAVGLVNTNSQYQQDSTFVPGVERITAYLEGSYDIAPGIEAYGELLMNRRETTTNGYRQVWTYLYSYDYSCSFNQFFDTGTLCHTGGDPFSVGWTGGTGLSPTAVVDHNDARQTVEYTRFVTGLRGEFAGWLGPMNWDIYYQNSRSQGEYSQDVILQDALYSSEGRSDSLRGPGAADDGTLARGVLHENSIPRPQASCVGYNTPISNRPCVDVDWMNPNFLLGRGFTDAEEAFLYDRETGNTEYTQQYVEASISGDLFTLPAGNIGFAVGAVWREDEILDTPGHATLAGNSWGFSASGITRGQDTTNEYFAEVAIPLLRDAPLAESLNLTLSGRHTEVDSSGEADTYKIGLSWQVTPEWLLRYTEGTSFRAPALFELYLAGETSFPSQRQIDPCIDWTNQLALGNITPTIAANCNAEGIPGNYAGAGSSATAFRNGGAGLLEPETSDARVFGIVWTPRWIDLQVALDYFEITVEDEVATLGSASIVFACYNSATFPVDDFCTLFNRTGTGANPFLIETVNNSFLNINNQENSGLDLTVRYGHELPFGELTVQGQFTYQIEDVISLFGGTTRDTNNSNGDPEFVGNVDFMLESGDWTYFWRTQLIGETDDGYFAPTSNGAVPPNINATGFDITNEFTTYHSASITREFDAFRLTVGAANLFDQDPPTVSTPSIANQQVVGPSTLQSQYDYVGRRIFMRFVADF